MKHILFVEDDDSLRSLYHTLFSSKDHDDIKVDFIANINDAREYLKTSPCQLIVLGISFPQDGRAGLTFLKELRDSNNNVPVVMYTAIPENTLRKDLEGRNCITVIPKSLPSKEVIERIEEAIFLIDAGITEESEHLEKLEELAVQFSAGPELEEEEPEFIPHNSIL